MHESHRMLPVNNSVKVQNGVSNFEEGVVVLDWLNVWLAKQVARGSNQDLATKIKEIGYLLPSSRDITENC